MKYFCALYITETMSSIVHEEVGGGGGGDRKAQTSRLPYLAFPAPLPFLAFLPFGLF